MRIQEGALSALKTPTNPPAKARLVPFKPTPEVCSPAIDEVPPHKFNLYTPHLDSCGSETLGEWSERNGFQRPPRAIAEFRLRKCDPDCPVLRRAKLGSAMAVEDGLVLDA